MSQRSTFILFFLTGLDYLIGDHGQGHITLSLKNAFKIIFDWVGIKLVLF